MRRVTWFAAGVVAGATGTGYAARKVKKTARALKPANVARGASTAVKRKSGAVAEAIREGRTAMRAKETELRAKRDGDVVLPVEPGQVIVLHDVRTSPTRRVSS